MNTIRIPDSWRGILLAACIVTLTACGGAPGGGTPGGNPVSGAPGCDPSDPGTNDDCGKLIIALTDAEGDFTSYTVDVLSITLEGVDGTPLEMLPQAARVDFAQLTSLSELISTATVVPAEFVGGTIRIDYSDAEIYLESNGSIVPAEVYDSAGTLLTASTPASIVDMEITLPDREHLVVTRGRTSMLSIDFDLTASHVIDTTTDPVSVVAAPYLVAEVQPVDEKEVRVRGALIDVDPDAGTYDIRMRPWMHRDGDYGEFTVMTHDSTEFVIDDAIVVGRDGLQALAEKPQGTLTVAFGTMNRQSRSFTADIVQAGDSLGGDRFTGVLGSIVSRSGDQLMIKGAVLIRRDRRAHFQRTVIVDVGPETAVSKAGDPHGDHVASELSVGQRTLVLGNLVNPMAASADPFGPDVALRIDATSGRARMLVTRLQGTVTRVLPGQIDIELRAINRLSASLFDFSGTGLTPDLDADPMNYEIATGTLDLSLIDALEPERPVRVLGFVSPFGMAPPDFEGRAVIGPRDLPAALGVGWGLDGTSAPFSVMGSDNLVIDLANPDIGLRHHMLVGDRLIDLYDLPASPAIIESGLPRIYGIHEPGHIELFKSFPDFVEELALRLSASDRARSLAAYGRYGEANNDLRANKVVVHMLPAPSP